MLKKCLNLFITGIILTAIGGIGIATLVVNGFDSISLGGQTLHDASNSVLEDYIIDETEAIESLEVSVDAGLVEIIHGDKFSISAESADGINSDDLDYKISNGCLKIDYSGSTFTIGFDKENIANSVNIIVTVPERVFEEIKFDVDAGTLFAENLTAKEFHLDFDAGNAEFNNIQATTSSVINMDFGSCVFENSIFNNVEVNMDAGEMNFDKCKIIGDNEINLDLGVLNMLIIGNRSNYEFEINNDLGDVTIDGLSYLDETDNDIAIDNTETIVVNLDLGECNINFMEEE